MNALNAHIIFKYKNILLILKLLSYNNHRILKRHSHGKIRLYLDTSVISHLKAYVIINANTTFLLDKKYIRVVSMKKQEYIKYWIQQSDKDYKSMINIKEKGENSWALFIGHLCIEKLIKALYIQNNDENNVPRIHNLPRLAELAKISIDESLFEKLAVITLFNIEARYPDYKNKFYNLCTDEYTDNKILEIEEVIKCLKSQIIMP